MPEDKHQMDAYEFYKVTKLRFNKIKEEVDGKMKSVDDKSAIVYNSRIKINMHIHINCLEG